MTPKTTPADLTALADLLDGDAFDLVAGIVADLRDEYPRMRDEDGEALDIDSGALLNRLIVKLRRVASEQPA